MAAGLVVNDPQDPIGGARELLTNGGVAPPEPPETEIGEGGEAITGLDALDGSGAPGSEEPTEQPEPAATAEQSPPPQPDRAQPFFDRLHVRIALMVGRD